MLIERAKDIERRVHGEDFWILDKLVGNRRAVMWYRFRDC
jgi:hypothetical protein